MAKLRLVALEDRTVPSFSYTLIDVPGAIETDVLDINDAGQIVGAYRSPDNTVHGFLFSGGVYTTIDPPGSIGTSANGIHSSGQIAGIYGDPGGIRDYGFLLSGGTYTIINPPGSTENGANKVNSSGQVVGQYSTGGYLIDNHGYLFSGGTYTTLDVPGATSTGATGINDIGQIVGQYQAGQYHGFLLSGGVYTTFDVPGSTQTRGYDINNAGQIVGMYESNGIHGYLLSGGNYTTLDVPGSTYTEAYGLNNLGQIVGSYKDGQGRPHGFLAVNVAGATPVVNAGPDQSVVRGAPLSATGSFTDPDADTWTATVNYGDGTGVQPRALNPDKTFALSHTYAAAGSYTATVTVTDSQGNVGSDTVAVTVTAVAVQPDPCAPGTTALVVGGTTGNDTIVVSPASGGAVAVTLNGTALGTFQPTGRVVVYGQAGDDDIQVAGGVARPAWLYGGGGNDRLKGGGGSNVLLGEAGNDLLVGGSDRDLLIGGTGADRIVGSAADDILIAGVTLYDANDCALYAVVREWTRTDKSYAERIDNLKYGTGLNGAIVLNAATVLNDIDADVLTGSSGSDWFLFDDDHDRVTDLHDESFLNDLPFING